MRGASHRFFILLILVLIGYFFVPSALAQVGNPADLAQDIQLSVSPSVVEMAVQPGKTVTKAFSFTNQGLIDLEVTTRLYEFGADEQTGATNLQGQTDFPYASLVNADLEIGDSFLLPAGEHQQLVLKIALPKDAKTRDWYLTLMAESKPSSQTQLFSANFAGSGGLVQASLGANVLLRVTNNNQVPLRWDLDLKLPRWIDSLQSLSFYPVVYNLSETYAQPEVTLVILNWRGEIVTEQEGLPQRVLAHSSRQLAASQVRTDDPRSLQGTAFKFDPLFALGRYTFRLSIANNTDGPLIVEKTVYAWPISLASAGLVLLIGLLALQKGKSYYQRQRQRNLLPKPGEAPKI